VFTESYRFTRQVAGRERQIEVGADLLTCWWGAEHGPQTREGIVHAHMHIIDDLIADQLKQGRTNPVGNDPIRLTSADYETELGNEFKLVANDE